MLGPSSVLPAWLNHAIVSAYVGADVSVLPVLVPVLLVVLVLMLVLVMHSAAAAVDDVSPCTPPGIVCSAPATSPNPLVPSTPTPL